MGKKVIFFIALFGFLLAFNIGVTFHLIRNSNRHRQTQQVLAAIDQIDPTHKQFTFSSAPLVMGSYEDTTTTTDARAVNLKAFFRKYNSPLYDHADFIVHISDKYQFDYRLLPAIAMQESNLCKKIPYESYNCWGWGIYGDLVTRFPSYEVGIETVAAGLKKNYIDKGLVTASAIMEKYTPSSNGSWAHGVNTFLNAVE